MYYVVSWVVLYSKNVYSNAADSQYFDVDPALVMPISITPITCYFQCLKKQKNSLLPVIAVMDPTPRFKSFQICLRHRIQ
jgi:hypothetical protein